MDKFLSKKIKGITANNRPEKMEWHWSESKGLYYNRNDNNMRDNKIKGRLAL